MPQPPRKPDRPEGSVERFVLDRMERDQSWRLFRIMGEFVEGFDRLAPYEPSVTIYGSARVAPGDLAYDQAEALGRLLAENGYAVVTGGGPGVMEAANKGASEAGGVSIGLGIDLPGERPNQYANLGITFHYFFVRKVMLVWRATAFVLMPGGLGTLDELFETITLIATEKMQRFPVILFGSDYWRGLLDWLEDHSLQGGYINRRDLALVTVTDDPMEVLRVVDDWHEVRGWEV